MEFETGMELRSTTRPGGMPVVGIAVDAPLVKLS